MTAKVILEWRNLNLVIEKKEFNFSKCRTNTEEKRILDNVNGSLKSGQLVAILGSSGECFNLRKLTIFFLLKMHQNNRLGFSFLFFQLQFQVREKQHCWRVCRSKKSIS